MKTLVTETQQAATQRAARVESHFRRARLTWATCFGLGLLTLATGCTALHPVRGVPASYLPDQFIGPSRDNKRTIDLSLLVRTPPDQYRVEAGDVLSIYIPRVLGVETTDVNSVGIAPPINMPHSPEDPPTVGYPIQIRDDNTISLPQIPPLYVGKMTLHEVEQAIFKTYTETHRILNPAEAMVLVSLQRPRMTRVLIVRQEATATLNVPTGAGAINIGSTGKGTARTVALKAYENDVLHALAQAQGADGLPGLDAENAIYIIRRRPRSIPVSPQDHIPVMPQSGRTPTMSAPGIAPVSGVRTESAEVMTALYETHSAALPAGQVPTAGQSTGILPVQYQRQAFPEAYSFPQSPMDRVNALSDAQRPVGRERATDVQPQPYHGQFTTPAGGPAPLPVQYQPVQYQVESVPAGQYSGGQPLLGQPPLPYGNMTEPGHSLSAPMLPPSPTLAPAYNQPNPMGSDLRGHSFMPSQMPAQAPVPEWNGVVEQGWASMLQDFDPTIDNPNVIRIPIRLGPGEFPQITEEQITLYDGDILFIDSRETEVFYTTGLLGGGQYTLPRDYDLGVLEAVSIAESKTMGGGGQGRSIGGVSAMNHDISTGASRLAIIRTLPNGKRITIEVDLKKAMRYREENIRIQPGDILVLQYTFPEAVSAFTHRYLLEGAIFGLAAGMMTQGR